MPTLCITLVRLDHKRTVWHIGPMSVPPKTFAAQHIMSGSLADMTLSNCNVRFTPKSGHSRPWSRPHLAVRLPKSHMTMGGGSDKSIDGRGDTSDHRRQQRDWP